jgi:flagellin
MAISILNNIASLTAQNQLAVTEGNLNKTLFQLSSGSRINSGADDAAGLAIADGLHANITALTQSAQNANSGVGSLQVADGSLAQVTSLLNRAVTLATESSNGTVSDTQRTALQAEYAQITAEIDRIGSKTSYNGSAVFAATPTSIFLSDGASNSTISVTTGALSAASVGLTAGTVNINTPITSATAQVSLLGDPQNGDQVNVDGTVYTFVTAGTVANNGEVAISAGNTNQTLLNLAHAINNSGGVANTDYKVAGADAHASATVAGTTLTLTSKTAGAAGNAFTLTTPTDASGNIAVSGATFSGGAAAASTPTAVTNTLSSQANAQASLGLINSAIGAVASLRGTLGANINRLQAASNVISNQVQNLTSAEDGIRAADIPSVVANLSRFTILNQSGISALAQANSAQQSILTLLR